MVLDLGMEVARFSIEWSLCDSVVKFECSSLYLENLQLPRLLALVRDWFECKNGRAQFEAFRKFEKLIGW